jgi:hypothetical protein
MLGTTKTDRAPSRWSKVCSNKRHLSILELGQQVPAFPYLLACIPCKSGDFPEWAIVDSNH